MRTSQTILAALLIASATSATAQQYRYTHTRKGADTNGNDTISSVTISRKTYIDGDSLIAQNFSDWDDFNEKFKNFDKQFKDFDKQFDGSQFNHTFIWKPKADDNDILSTIIFYRDRYTGEDNNKNTALLLNLSKYLKKESDNITEEEARVVSEILSQMKKATKSDVLWSLLKSCQESFEEKEDPAMLAFLERIDVVSHNHHSLYRVYEDLQERLLPKTIEGVSQPTLRRLRAFQVKWEKDFGNTEEHALKTLNYLIHAIEDASAETANKAYCEQLQGIDKGIRAAQKGSYDKELEMVNELIKEESKRGMNQATLDYTRKIFGGWAETRAFFGKAGIKVAKTIETAQKKIDKQNQKKLKMLRKKTNMS